MTVQIAIAIVERLMMIFSGWLMFLMIYQIVLSFVGFKRKT